MTWDLYWLACIGAPLWPLIVWLVWRDARRRRGGRWSLLRKGLTGLLTFLWAVCVWSFFIEPETLVVRHVTVRSAAWHGAPLRIGMISDTHAGGPHASTERLARVVARMNVEHPDLVVLLGDYVGGHGVAGRRTAAQNEEIRRGVGVFRKLVAPQGVVAVWGNHDWWYGGDRVAGYFRETGIPLIENAAIPVVQDGRTYWVAGLAEKVSRRQRPSFDRALADVPAGADVIAIAHRPDVFFATPLRVAVTLAGHTHCGQVNFPVFGRPFLPGRGSERWPCGAYVEGGRQLYVTGGVGVSVLPARLNAPPEIVIVTLRGG